MFFFDFRTYKAILRGDHVEWRGEAPDQSTSLEVEITVLKPESASSDSGRRMAAALERLALAGGITGIKDPSRWQREPREDRPLLGRAD